MSAEKLNRKMSAGHVPSRVILLAENSYCKDVRSSEAGLIGSDTWCSSGSAVSNKVLLDPHISHCHLFGVKALQQLTEQAAGCSICHHLSVDERLNGKIDSNVHRCPTVPGGGSSSIQLATVTCSYGIPSDVECLDLAVNCLQRISGSYFFNQNLPCVVSMCQCHTKNCAQKTEQTAVGSNSDNVKKCPSKAHECSLPAVSELSPCRTKNDSNSCSNFEQTLPQKQQRRKRVSPRCTRSTSKQPIDDVLEPTGASTSHSLTVAIQSINGALADSIHSERLLKSAVIASPVVSESHSALPGKTRSTVAAAENSLSCAVTEMPKLKTIRKAAPKPLTRHRRRLQKVMANKKQQKQHVAAASQWTRRLRVRSQPSSSSSSSLLAFTDNGQQQSAGSGSSRVNAMHCRHSSYSDTPVCQQNAGSSGITAVSGITAACEVVVPRLAIQRHWNNQQLLSADDIAVPALSANDGAAGTRWRRQMSPSAGSVECTDAVSDRQDVSTSNIINCSVAVSDRQTLSALSVDTSIIDYNDTVCSSPASPLPLSRNKMHCNSLLQTPASLTPRRSALSAHLTKH